MAITGAVRTDPFRFVLEGMPDVDWLAGGALLALACAFPCGLAFAGDGELTTLGEGRAFVED